MRIFMNNIFNSIKDFYEFDYEKFYVWLRNNYDMSKEFDDMFKIYCEYYSIIFKKIGFEIDRYELGMHSVDRVELGGAQAMLHAIKDWHNAMKEKLDLDCSSVLMDVLEWKNH